MRFCWTNSRLWALFLGFSSSWPLPWELHVFLSLHCCCDIRAKSIVLFVLVFRWDFIKTAVFLAFWFVEHVDAFNDLNTQAFFVFLYFSHEAPIDKGIQLSSLVVWPVKLRFVLFIFAPSEKGEGFLWFMSGRSWRCYFYFLIYFFMRRRFSSFSASFFLLSLSVLFEVIL